MCTCFDSGQAVAAEEEEEEEEEDPQEELNALIEEANVPLHSLLAKYRSTNVSEDTEGIFSNFKECGIRVGSPWVFVYLCSLSYLV